MAVNDRYRSAPSVRPCRPNDARKTTVTAVVTGASARSWEMDSRVRDLPAVGTVFVIDDDPAMRDSLRVLLEVRGLAAECFDSVAAFRASRNAGATGCLILDLHMPRSDGLELLETLAAEGSQLRTIMLSGAFGEGFRARAMAAGAVACIDKPFEPSRLIEAVKAALRAARKDGP